VFGRASQMLRQWNILTKSPVNEAKIWIGNLSNANPAKNSSSNFPMTIVRLSIYFFLCFGARPQIRTRPPHCSGFLITHTSGMNLLKWWPAGCSDRYLHNTQQTQETNIHALSGIQTRDPSNQTTAYIRHRPHGHRDWHLDIYPY